MIVDNIVTDSYLANFRRDFADDIIAGLFILFGVDSEHEDHSEELPLFVGCIVSFIVSYLICMFQDSGPAGSYNDPFLSSVCVCVSVSLFLSLSVCMYLYVSVCMYMHYIMYY